MTDSARIAVLQQMLRSSSREVLVACRDLIEPMLRHDPFKVLPVELSLRILSYIRDPQSLAAASQVSRLWYLILSDDYTWKRLCEAHHFRRLSAAGAHVPQDINGRVDTASFKNVKEIVFNPSAAQNVIPTSYRSHFKQQYLLNSAWDNGGRLAARYVLNHTEDIIATVLLMEASYFCVALNNSRIMVFGLNGRLVSCLYGHVLGVWALALKNHTLLSGGCDRDVRVWDLQTGLCTRILQGHTSTVRCLAMASPSIGISGSRDATIRIWNLDTGECLHVLEGHTGSVRRLEVTGDYLVSASYDCTAKVWRISTGELLHTLQGHFSQIYSLAVDGNTIATGSLDMTIWIWDLETGECRAVLQGHLALVGQLQLRGNTLVSGGSDSAIRVWDLTKMQCVHRIAAHDNSVTCLQFDDERIVSGGPDGSIHVWSLQTGKHLRTIGEQFDTVWGIAFREDRLAFVGSKDENTIIELLSFVPE